MFSTDFLAPTFSRIRLASASAADAAADAAAIASASFLACSAAAWAARASSRIFFAASSSSFLRSWSLSSRSFSRSSLRLRSRYERRNTNVSKTDQNNVKGGTSETNEADKMMATGEPRSHVDPSLVHLIRYRWPRKGPTRAPKHARNAQKSKDMGCPQVLTSNFSFNSLASLSFLSLSRNSRSWITHSAAPSAASSGRLLFFSRSGRRQEQISYYSSGSSDVPHMPQRRTA